MKRLLTYKTQVEWTGNKGVGTLTAAAYERSHSVSIEGKPLLLCSSDAPFRGDVSKHNPERFYKYFQNRSVYIAKHQSNPFNF